MNFLHASGAALADDIFRVVDRPQLYILTGESGAGKTSACQRLIRQARRRACPAAGLFSPPVYQAGEKTAIDLTAVTTGETRRLAQKRPRPTAQDGMRYAGLGWDFDPQVIAWGNQVLDELPAAPLLILDELGPLEFRQGAGFTAGLRLLDERRHWTACVVIRPACLPEATARWPWGMVIHDLEKAGAGGPV